MSKYLNAHRRRQVLVNSFHGGTQGGGRGLSDDSRITKKAASVFGEI